MSAARSIDLDEYDAQVWAVGQQRIKVIAALAAAEKVDKTLIEAAVWQLGICRAYCYRSLRRYREDASVTRLMPQVRGRVVGAKVLDPAIDTLVESAINDFYLTPGTSDDRRLGARGGAPMFPTGTQCADI